MGWGDKWIKVDNPWPDNKEWEKFKIDHPIKPEDYQQEWPDIKIREITEYKPLEGQPITKEDLAGGPVWVGVDLASKPDQTAYGKWEAGKITELTQEEFNKVVTDAQNFGTGYLKDGKHVSLHKVYLNQVPTHDPYTNPNAQIYYECKCGQILDPGTKSFAALNNHASEKGWKIRFGETSYQPYCVECGKEVE